jgi:hypothetical protein
MLEIIIGALLAAAILGTGWAWLVLHRRRMEEYRYHRDQFFARAEQLLKDDTATDAMLLGVKEMAIGIEDVRNFDWLSAAVSEIGQQIRAGRFKPSGTLPSVEWTVLLFSYYLALSYLKSFRGVLLRAALARLLDPSASARTAEAIDRRVHSARLQPA